MTKTRQSCVAGRNRSRLSLLKVAEVPCSCSLLHLAVSQRLGSVCCGFIWLFFANALSSHKETEIHFVYRAASLHPDLLCASVRLVTLPRTPGPLFV